MIIVKPPFVEDTHTYFKPDGTPFAASVTGNLKDGGFYADEWFTEFGRTRGALVHRLTEFDDLGDLDEATVDPALQPYLDAWRQFKRDFEIEIATVNGELCIERGYGDDVFDVAGTVDRIGWWTLKGKRYFGPADLKSGAYEPWHPIQLAAYADFIARSGEFPNEPRLGRLGVYITSDGKYEPRPYTDRNDLKVWQAAVTVAAWKRANGRATRKAA